MLNKIKYFVISVINGKKKGALAYLTKGILWALSLVYRLGIYWRNWLYDHRWLPSYYPPVSLVISVGNISSGGTGKTPLTLLLAQQLGSLFASGELPVKKVAILSRGYGSPAEKEEQSIILSRGQGPLYPASFCGDEAYLLSKNLPHLLFVVGADRKQSAKEAMQLGADLLILDDAFQHRAIERHLNLVVMDASNPFGCEGDGERPCEALLPRGFLREPPSSLGRADMIILNHVRSREMYEKTQLLLKRYSQVPCVGFTPRFQGIYDQRDQLVQLDPNVKVAIFCGIGSPYHFYELIEAEGFRIVDELICQDHMIPTGAALAQFADWASQLGAEALLCTEKDAVKLNNTFVCSLPIFWIKMDLELVYGIKGWNAMIHGIKKRLVHF